MAIAALSGWTSEQKHVVTASFLGWSLDAFDFFLLVFVLKDIAEEFQTDISNVTLAILLTLAMRPVGAFIFGRAADRWGRRPTLMVNILLYSILEFASGFAPSLTALIILRALYGVAMGGEWGVGASLTMESIPPHPPWFRFRAASIGLSHRLFSGVDRLWPPVSIHRMARHVHGRRHPRACGLLYPTQRAGIAKLEQAGNCRARQHAGDIEIALGPRPIRRVPDDRVQLLQPRYAGPLPDLPGSATEADTAHGQHHRGHL
jgi:hypothetical protein